MATDVDVAFQILADGLASSSEETRAAAKHRASLEACLTTQFGMTSFFLSGSFGHGTNILRYSDVDRFAVIPTEKLLENSNAALKKIAAALRKTFPQTRIRVDAPGLRLPFGFKNKELTEVIPADEVGETKLGYRLFEIADGNGGWLRVAPESHTAYVTEIDEALSGRLKSLIRIIKAWKYYRNIPIRSFYLEMRISAYASTESEIIYDFDVAEILATMAADGLAPITDPRGISGALSPCKTPLQYRIALARLKQCTKSAELARIANYEGKTRRAFFLWRRIFANKFPRYGG